MNNFKVIILFTVIFGSAVCMPSTSSKCHVVIPSALIDSFPSKICEYSRYSFYMDVSEAKLENDIRRILGDNFHKLNQSTDFIFSLVFKDIPQLYTFSGDLPTITSKNVEVLVVHDNPKISPQLIEEVSNLLKTYTFKIDIDKQDSLRYILWKDIETSADWETDFCGVDELGNPQLKSWQKTSLNTPCPCDYYSCTVLMNIRKDETGNDVLLVY